MRPASFVFLSFVSALLAGCGGGGSSRANDGLSQVTIDWPATTKGFAGSPIAGSAHVVFATPDTLTSVADFTIVRPAGTDETTKSYTLPTKVAPGTYVLTLLFCNGSAGDRTLAVGFGTASATVASDGSLKGANGKGLGDFGFTSTLKTLTILANQTVAVGQKTSLQVMATTSNGGIVAIPFSQLSLASSNGSVLKANDDGTVTGVTAGTANVTATAFGLPSVPASVTVTGS